MSLLIDIDKIHHVLLADGWHHVDIGPNGLSSFYLDAYEFGEFVSRGEQEKEFRCVAVGGAFGISNTGAAWMEDDDLIITPLNQIIAIRTEKRA